MSRPPHASPRTVLRTRPSLGVPTAVLIVSIAACSGGGTGSNDDASVLDGAIPSDASTTTDASSTTDATVVHDAASTTDAATVVDAGIDAAVAIDAGATLDAGTTEPSPTVAWVMSYFGPEQNLDADSLHLAYSTDGLHWYTLGGGMPAYRLSGFGSNHVRDPFVFRRADGTFGYVATDWTLAENDANYWNRPSSKIVVATSTDLIHFTDVHLLDLSDLPGPGGSEMHAWAPEAYYDASNGRYAIVWSGNDSTGENHIYVSYTEDFQTVETTSPPILFDPGYSVIDATIVEDDGARYLFYKDETDNSGLSVTGSGKDIQVARSLDGSMNPGSFVRWDPDYITRGASQGTRQATEGPFVLPDPSGERFYLYADFYLNGGVFGLWSAPDLDADPGSWTRYTASEFALPAGVRHANTVRVTQAELDALLAHYGAAYRLRTGYTESGNVFYVGHSWYHGVIARSGEPSMRSTDFNFRVVPGLADPNDPDLVSFEAVGVPGRYLRIDGSDPNRYPVTCPGSQGATYGWALCNVAEADRHHMVWVDPFVDDAAFRADATFRRMPAANGDQEMNSFAWYPEPTRLLRHAYYQMFAHVSDGSAGFRAAASFRLEQE